MDEEIEDPQVQLHVRMPRSVRDRVVDYARRLDRSLNWTAVYLLRKSLDTEEER